MSQNEKASVTQKETSMRDNIKELAKKLLIAHGYHKTTFGVIARELDITTTNIHYHFGNKNSLVEEVVKDYVQLATSKQQAIWLDQSKSLQEKVQAELAFNRSLFKKFNPNGKTRNPWSLISRLRLEGDVLTEPTRVALAGFTTDVRVAVESAVEHAIDSGELKADAPKDDLVLLLTHLVDSLSVFAQDAGGFERVELFLNAFSRIVLTKYTH